MVAELLLDGTSANRDLDAALRALPGPALRALAVSGAQFEARHRAEGDRPMADFWRVVSIAADDTANDRTRALADLERDIRPQGYRMPQEDGDRGEPMHFDFPNPDDLTEEDGK